MADLHVHVSVDDQTMRSFRNVYQIFYPWISRHIENLLCRNAYR